MKRLPEGEFIDYLLQDDSSVSVPETGTEPDPESETQNLPESPSYNRDVSMSLPPFGIYTCVMFIIIHNTI